MTHSEKSVSSDSSTYFTHPRALVATEKIGAGTRIWAHVNIMEDVEIGRNCNICDMVLIENGVRIGNDVTVKPNIYICDGVILEDSVFIGPGVSFTNDMTPRSRQYVPVLGTHVHRGASIGANATIIAGVTIGEYAMIGAGSVITRDVPPYALVFGNPARRQGWVDEKGDKLTHQPDGTWISSEGKLFLENENGLQPA